MVLSTATPDTTAELTWEIAQLFPAQGHWSEGRISRARYQPPHRVFARADGGSPLAYLLAPKTRCTPLPLALGICRRARPGGLVMFAPLRIQLGQGKFREPDLVFMAAEHADRLGEQFWHGADLVMEVVSPDDPERDKVTKRREYAQAGIPEYWIVDPTEASITVLTLQGTGIRASRRVRRWRDGTVCTSGRL